MNAEPLNPHIKNLTKQKNLNNNNRKNAKKRNHSFISLIRINCRAYLRKTAPRLPKNGL